MVFHKHLFQEMADVALYGRRKSSLTLMNLEILKSREIFQTIKDLFRSRYVSYQLSESQPYAFKWKS